MTDARAITKALTRGQWHGSYGTACCPAHDDRTPSLKIKDDPAKRDGIDVHCFVGCDWRDVKAELRRLNLVDDFTPVIRKIADEGKPDTDQAKRIRYALDLWRASRLVSGTLGWRYFAEQRGLDVGAVEFDHALRWHQGVGAVIALMTDPVTNKPTGVHRTFLNPDGSKRERKMLGKQGVVRLSPDDEITSGLGIVEGVEDGLAVLLSGWAPIWAATSAGAVQRFPILAGVEAITIFADDDTPGMKAASACAERWARAGREARVAHLKDAL